MALLADAGGSGRVRRAPYVPAPLVVLRVHYGRQEVAHENQEREGGRDVSVTSQLAHADSPLSRFLAPRFAETRPFLTALNRELKGLPLLEAPIGLTPVESSIVGMAFDYRERYYFAITPPEQFVAHHGIEWAVRATADHDRRYTLLIDMDTGRRSMEVLDSDGAEPYQKIIDLCSWTFRRIGEVAERVAPVGRKLSRAEEDDLNCQCALLALFEQCFRNGNAVTADWPIVRALLKRSADAVYALVKAPWLEDLRALSLLFQETQGDLFGKKAILNPVFAGSRDVDGADADLVVDGCLIDITTAKSPLNRQKIYQLIAYALLDYDDTFRIERLGLYIARRGQRVEWPVDKLLTALAGRPAPALRDLRVILRKALAVEGAASPSH